MEEERYEPEEGAEAPHGDSLDDEGAVSDKLKKLRTELKEAKEKEREYLAGWQRAKADYINLKREQEDSRAYAHRLGISVAAKALLPALDALERARAAGKISEEFARIEKLILAAFPALDIYPVEVVVGAKFNPSLHEALGQDPVDSNEKDDTITLLLEKGWRVGDDVIRPAKVRVGVCKVTN